MTSEQLLTWAMVVLVGMSPTFVGVWLLDRVMQR